MSDRHPTSRVYLSRDEAKLLDKVRKEVASIAAQARGLAPDELQQFIAQRIDQYTAPMADVSELLARAVARLLSMEVRRLLTH